METYNPPRRKIPTKSTLCCLDMRSPRITFTGSRSINISTTNSTAPIAIQNILKSKQYPPTDGPIQSLSMGRQLIIVAIVPTIHQTTTIIPTSSDSRRKYAAVHQKDRDLDGSDDAEVEDCGDERDFEEGGMGSVVEGRRVTIDHRAAFRI
jgi:hypothetical protein